ncbi:DNA polymerase-3 subunit epsilon [Lutibacter sp. Hel_I_33_5]|nr:DNA polymerase-3 subunit epsilon [Lutibacter sp. Hel_I_33_5]
MYAILDIETTGGKFNEEGITEIAIYKYDGTTVIDQFISLVNPEKEIQEFVVKLTGINNKMLRNAPKFFEVAKRIIEITQDCTLVAHNTDFDYRILRTEFRRLGYDFLRNTICTVELSKQLIPDQPTYKLGKLAKALGIPMTDRHRASGDALATVQLFKMLLDKNVDKSIIEAAVKYHDNRNQIEKEQKILNSIPENMGVFYVHRSDGTVIYIGRGSNMKSEVNKLFLKSSNRAKKIQSRVSKVSFEETGNVLFTRLKFYTELDVLKPKYNLQRAKKINHKDFGNDNMIVLENGRKTGENGVILVENNEIFGYGYTNLAHQENQLEVLKNIVTPFENKALAKNIVANYLQKNAAKKIIRF